MSTFKLVVKGELLPGQELEQVKERIARLFKLQDKPDQLAALFSGKPVTVKKGLSEAQARAYSDAIENAGLGCELVAEGVGMPVEPQQQASLAMEAQPSEQPAQAEGETYAASTPVAAEPPAMNSGASQQSATAPAAESADDFNPYQQPQADLFVAQGTGELVLAEPRKLRMGAGWSWFSEGFGYFKRKPFMWLGTVVLFVVAMVILSMIPVLNLLLNLLSPVITGGFMVMCHKLYQDESTGVGDMFAGFKTHLGGLLLVGLLCVLGYILIAVVVVAVVFGGAGVLGAIAAMNQGSPEALSFMMLALLVAMGLMIPLFMAYWFAPALVMLHNLPALRAMLLSFKGCLRNILPFLVYGLVGLVLAIIATIPIALGWLVLMPVMWGSMFAGYRQIFTDLANEQD